MTEDTCYSLICTIYTTFQKSSPSRSSAIVVNLQDRLRHIPDAHAHGIRAKFEDMDDMPKNLGKAILGAWETYKLENNIATEAFRCNTCQGAGGWECWEQIDKTDDPADGKIWHHFWGCCPACTTIGGDKARGMHHTPQEWKARGVKVMPTNYPGGWVKFRQDNGISPKCPPTKGIPRNVRDLVVKVNKRTGYDRSEGYDDVEARSVHAAPEARW